MDRAAKYSSLARVYVATVGMSSALLLSACSGGGGSNQGAAGGFIPANTQSAATTTSSISMSTTGAITALTTDGFYLDTGYPHGKIRVYTSSATAFSGAAPSVTENVAVNGTGSWSTSITATSVSQVSTATAATPIPTPFPMPSGVVSSIGKIVSLRTGGGFTLDQGSPNGKIPVAIASGALIVGGSAAAGLYAQVTGPGSVHSSIIATVVTYSSAAPVSVSATGTIVGGTSYGFVLNVDTNHPSVPVVLSPAAVIAGGTLIPGSKAQVTGTGSVSTTITPVQAIVTDPTPQPLPNQTPSPTPGPIAQKHLLTGDYLGGYFGTRNIAWSSAAPYLTWAQTGVTDANAISVTGIKTQFYTIPTRLTSGDPMFTSDETTYAHDCNGNRITTAFGTTTQYISGVTSSSLWSLYTTTVTRQIGTAHFDAIFEDDAGPLSAYGLATLPCGYSDSTWLAGGKSLNDAAPRPVIFNGLSSLNGHGVSLSLGLLSSTNTIGGNMEHCYSDNAIPEQNAWSWIAMENSELQVASQHKLFECMLRNTNAASSSQIARTYALASFLLTYDPATSILWEEFATTSGFHVEPESQLIALNPVTPQPSSIAGLLTATGAYGREYLRCYYAGKFVGPCAIAVNSDTAVAHLFPYPQYSHTLVLSGGGILDGGTVSFSGAAAPLYLQPESAVIAFP